MRLGLFGVGTKGLSPAITAQKRINCFVDVRQHAEKTSFALVGRRGLSLMTDQSGINPTRGMWAVNSLANPLLFFVQGQAVYTINNGLVLSVVGQLITSSGNVSMVDDGTYLMIVDGQFGYYYNMLTTGPLTVIVDGNFTTSPGYVTWQDTYFIVTSHLTNQFQLSDNANPATWPAVNINFSGSSAALQGAAADHGILYLFGPNYTEFWQDTGSPDFPYAKIPGASAEFGLTSPWSISKFDNTVIGLFSNISGQLMIGRMSGFTVKRVSNQDIEAILDQYPNVDDASAFSFQSAGHPMYIIHFPSSGKTWQYDGMSQIWSEVQATDGSAFWGSKGAFFVNESVVNDRRNGNLYRIDGSTFTDNGSEVGMEVWSQHIWKDDHYIGINRVQIDVESGTGTATGQGVNPVMTMEVSKDGGNSFFAVGYSSIGPVGEYTQRVVWSALGAARDWVLKLRVTDPVKRVITGATAEIVEQTF